MRNTVMDVCATRVQSAEWRGSAHRIHVRANEDSEQQVNLMYLGWYGVWQAWS